MKDRFETFTVLINRISRSIRRLKNQEMPEYNLRSAHISCLYYLYFSENMTASELCERCEEDKATVSRALVFLQDNGFLECETKRYKSPLRLTEQGKIVGKKVHDAVGRVLDEVAVGLTDAQRDEFYHSLAIISDNLEKITRNNN